MFRALSVHLQEDTVVWGVTNSNILKQTHTFTGVSSDAVCWGTALQPERPRVRLPTGSLGFFIDLIFLPHSASNKNEYQGYLLRE